jgi:Tfp pilus assembly protein PilN
MKAMLNLLPVTGAGQAGKKNALPFYSLIAACICFLVLMALWASTLLKLKNISGEGEALLQRKAELQVRLDAARGSMPDREASPGEKMLSEIQATHPWSSILSELSLIIPEKGRLSAVETRQDNNVISFKGYAVSQLDVATLIASLERSEYFEGIEIISSQKGAKEVFFELKAKLIWSEKK